MKILITAGPTREYFDDVRFLSNPSTGRMGIETALAFASAGHDTVLVLGPASQDAKNLSVLPNLKVIHVVTADEMLNAVSREFAKCQVFIATAAVSDYRPSQKLAGKMKKDAQEITVTLARNPDILAEMSRRKTHQLLFGFALESEFGSPQGEENAKNKLMKKNLDAVVLNPPASFGVSEIQSVIFHKDGKREERGPEAKRDLAIRLVKLAGDLAGK